MRSVLLAIALASASAEAQVSVVSEGRAPENDQQFVLRSPSLGHDVLVVVSTPAVGVPGIPARRPDSDKAPAIYALDMGYGVAGPVGKMMSGVSAISATYVVSIGYPGANYRDTDLLFDSITENDRTFGGGGAKFQTFLTDELRPFLEKRYPLDPSKAILFGHSFGGLFAANVLARKPSAFGGYIIGSPSVRYDPGVVERIGKSVTAGGGRRVFVSAGEKESYGIVEGAKAISAALGAPGSSFKVAKQIYSGEGHISYYPKLVPDAFIFMLPPGVKYEASVVVPRAAMERVAGVYKLPDGRAVTVIFRDGKLFVRMTGISGESEILPDSETQYFIPGFDTVINFVVPPSGVASAVNLKINGVQIQATRE